MDCQCRYVGCTPSMPERAKRVYGLSGAQPSRVQQQGVEARGVARRAIAAFPSLGRDCRPMFLGLENDPPVVTSASGRASDATRRAGDLSRPVRA